ncbi:MAG: hypothetical protein ABJA37_08960 [Ferruginibacter sp.]
MQQLITSYLFKNKNCPLPEVGTLHIIEGNAVSAFGEIKITAPVAEIQLSTNEIPASHFIKYIAAKKNITIDDAAQRLGQYCQKLNQIQEGTELPLTGAGTFYVTNDGSLQFKPTPVAGVFFPAVAAERIIHPNDSHAMLVGDTHTTNTVMSDFYNEGEAKPRSRWWLWAIALAVLAAMLLVIYFNDKNSNASFGNAQSYTSAT